MRSPIRFLFAALLGLAFTLTGIGVASASVPAHYPIGHLDSVKVSASGSSHYATVAGWAFDPDARATSIAVVVKDNGGAVWSTHTSAYRSDVNRIYHLTGNHGYSIRFGIKPGRHTICVRQGNLGPGATDTSNCITVSIAAPAPAPAPTSCGAPANPYGYNFCSGPLVYSPPSDICNYFSCIGNFWNGSGYMTECNDGMYSMSGGRSGACSYHGGESRPVYA